MASTCGARAMACSLISRRLPACAQARATVRKSRGNFMSAGWPMVCTKGFSRTRRSASVCAASVRGATQ